MTFVLGLTGSMGMGKTTTAGFFKSQDIPVWSADERVHHLYRFDQVVIRALSDLIPESLGADGIDRSILRSAISQDPDLLPKIEALVHPILHQDRARFKKTNDANPLILFDIPLLYEKKLEDECDAVLVVSIDEEVQRQRLYARGHMSKEEIEGMLSRQMPDAMKRARADFIIETQSLKHVEAEVALLIEKLTQPAS